MPKRRSFDSRVIPAVLGVLIVFSAGFSIGRQGLSLPGQNGSGADFANFYRAKSAIEQKFPRDVPEEQLITGATKGLVEGTGDPYSTFLTRDEANQLDQALAGTVEGIGVEIGPREGGVAVIAPLPDSPAAKAGIVAGDSIVAVEGEATAGKAIDEVAKKIRGAKGTPVKVTIQTAGQEARELTITRDTIRAPSVELTYRDNVAVIELSRFGDDTKAEFDKIVADVQAKKPRGIVLDMRSNPGGFLEGAISISSIFLTEGDVVQEQFADNRSETRRANPDGRLASYPLVVLVNKGSASASEIAAGALRDNRSIKLVGEKTFGKGSVQELQQLGDGAVLKLTIAEYKTPKGTTVSGQGLSPDVEAASDNPEAQLQAAIGQL